MKYHCIAMDPPWNEQGGGKCKRGADKHYPVMGLSDITKTILGAPCWKPADDCHLWMWVTDNHLLQGLSLISQLGFRYIRMMPWVKAIKVRVHGHGFRMQSFGLGQYLRGEHEVCLLAVRGDGIGLVQNRDEGSVVIAPKTKHSVKPQEAYDKIERVSPGPRLEMFARTTRPGLDVWGNEVK